MSGVVYESLRPWCYTSLLADGSNSIASIGINVFINSTHLVHRCTNSTSIDYQDHRILFTLEYWLSWNASEVSVILCEPKHSLTRRIVTNITNDVGVHDSLRITGPIIETLDMGIQPFKMTQRILNRGSSAEWTADLPGFKWSMWFTMLNATQPQNSLSNFRNTSLVIELPKRVWQGLAAYVVKQEYTYPTNQTTSGTIMSAQGRICVQMLPLRLLEALMALLFLSCIGLCFLQPAALHRDPTSLGGHVMILARSSGLVQLLESHGAASKKTLRSNLSGFLVSYSQHLPPDSPAIALQQSCQGEEKLASDYHGLQEWWCPISVRWWFRVCVLVATLGIMVALEVLFHISARRNGLGDVSLDDYSKYMWTLLPTSVLAVVGLLFSMIDSTARTLHPFQLLRKGGVTLAEIIYDPARQVSLMAVIRAAWKRHFPLLWAILPGLLAPVLTVVTSGLYTVVPIPWTYKTELQLKRLVWPREPHH